LGTQKENQFGMKGRRGQLPAAGRVKKNEQKKFAAPFAGGAANSGEA
jgi:hypothetical protein